MNCHASSQKVSKEEVYHLAVAVIEDDISEADARRFESLIATDPTARGWYVDLICDACSLRRLNRSQGSCVTLSNKEDIVKASEPIDSAPVLGFLSPIFHGTIGYFSDGMPLAYLLATVITGLGLLAGSFIHVSGPEQVALVSSVVVEPALVGRITGMVDCQWEKEGSGVRGQGSDSGNLKSFVSLGQKFALASGLMEISYHTGAKVILQGPATYEVESNGGYLAMGKLTGKLEKKSSGSDLLGSNLFVIRTPVAGITDLGTEFGVEVSINGATNTQVFAGQVQVTTSAREGQTRPQTRIVHAGQFAHIRQDRHIVLSVPHPADANKRFTRVLPARLTSADAYAELIRSMNPIAYYRMERPTDEKHGNVILDSAPGGHHGTLHLADEFGGEPWWSGRFGEALYLRGVEAGDYVDVRDFPATDTDQLSFSAWVYAVSTPGYIACECGDDSWEPCQFAIAIGPKGFLEVYVRQRNGSAMCGVEALPPPSFPIRRWEHVAFVADGSRLHLYHNGVEVSKTPCGGICRTATIPHLGIGAIPIFHLSKENSGVTRHPLHGRIDELAVFYHALSAEQVRQLFQGCRRGPTNVIPAAKEKP